MDLTSFARKDYLTVDELTSSGRVGVVISEPYFKSQFVNGKRSDGSSYEKELKILFLPVQMSKTKETRPVRLGTSGSPNTACKSLVRLFGYNTTSWIGKPLEFYPVPYGEGKVTLGVKSYSLDVEKVSE